MYIVVFLQLTNQFTVDVCERLESFSSLANKLAEEEQLTIKVQKQHSEYWFCYFVIQQEHSRATEQSCEELTSSMASLRAGVSDTGLEWRSQLDCLSSGLSDFSTSQVKAIVQTRDMVDSFVKEDIKPDLPTGKHGAGVQSSLSVL